MPDLDTTIADGDPNHALLHQDANIEVNSLRGRAATLETTVASQASAIATKYTKPAAGIPQADLSAPVQTALNTLGLANFIAVEWTGNTATVRPTDDPTKVVVWIKRDKTLVDPPRDSTHMLVGKDLLLRAF